MTGDVNSFDLIVVGGGLGGLATATLAQRCGLRTALIEAHTRLGGCAGDFERQPFTFDAGATALVGLGAGEPIGDLLACLDISFETAQTSSYRVHLPDRVVDLVTDRDAFHANMRGAFPEHPRAVAAFWSLQEAVGQRLFTAASGIPRFPMRTIADFGHNARILGLRGMLGAGLSTVTVDGVLAMLGVRNDREFRAFLGMLLEDTAQAGPEVVPFANAATCLQAYRAGMCRPRGGMGNLMQKLADRYEEMGGCSRLATIVDKVEAIGTRAFRVQTRRREQLTARHVAFNTPPDLALGLLGRDPDERQFRRSAAVWSAFTGYVAIRAEAIPESSPLFHQVLRRYDVPSAEGNNVLVSLSPPGDTGYGPPDVRVGTLSTHTRPELWSALDREEYTTRKAEYRGRLLAALERALPGAGEALVHAEFASPRSFQRYTRRTRGAVGGPPVSRWNSNAFALGSDALGPGLWLVGDSVFPGQGTLAVVLCAIRVVERLTGLHWRRNNGFGPAPKRESRAPREKVVEAAGIVNEDAGSWSHAGET